MGREHSEKKLREGNGKGEREGRWPRGRGKDKCMDRTIGLVGKEEEQRKG